jgi:NAD+ kinase
MGGDGTMLGIARQLAPFDVPLIGINQGRLGFMTDIPLEGMHDALARILSGRPEPPHLAGRARDARRRHHPRRHGGQRRWWRAAPAPAWPSCARVDVDGQFMYNQRSDGLIISTPPAPPPTRCRPAACCTRRWAASCWCRLRRTRCQPPHRAAESSEIVVEIVRGATSASTSTCKPSPACRQDQIVIQRSPHAITFLHPEGWSYHTLREKLHWNEYPSHEGKLN